MNQKQNFRHFGYSHIQTGSKHKKEGSRRLGGGLGVIRALFFGVGRYLDRVGAERRAWDYAQVGESKNCLVGVR